VIRLCKNLETTEQRRRNMQAIRSKGTKLEERVTKALWEKGIRFRKNVNSLFGKPDIAIKKYKIVIFIDSCFWHACELHGNMPVKNKEFWESKLRRNVDRDLEVTNYYLEKGWHILRIWEHELKSEKFDSKIEEIKQFIHTKKKK
jgi:DNA mismatch endonuclease, patch repair protein